MKPEERKKALILRDPKGHEFQRKFKAWLGEIPERPTFKLRDYGKYKAEILPLRKFLEEKYCIGIWIPNTTFEGLTHDWYITRELKWNKAVEDLRGDRDSEFGGGLIVRVSKDEITGNLDHKVWDLSELKGYLVVDCPSHKLPILIDTSLITLNDAAKIKKAVWKIVEDELLKRRQGKAKSPWKEPPELLRLMRCHEKTFLNYLRWYDLKTKAGLTFRLIATIEREIKDPGKRRQIFEGQELKMKKTPISGKVKGESTIRGGFNSIYQAIFRTPAPEREEDITVSESYHCPDHGNSCTEDCAYLQSWYRKFDKLYAGQLQKEQNLERRMLHTLH